MCYWTLVQTVCPNHEVVVLQPLTVTAPYLGSIDNITTILSLQTHLFPPNSASLFTSPPGHISYLSPIFQPSTPRLSLFVPAYTPPPPPSYRPGLERPSTWMDPSPASLHRLSDIPSHSGRTNYFLALACDWLLSSGCPPFAVPNLTPGPCQPQMFSCPRVPSSRCLPPSSARLLHPFPASTGVPVPFRSQVVGVVFFFTPSLVHLHCPPCVTHHLLVYSGVLFTFLGVLLS